LLPIVARPPENERRAVDAIYSMQIWSPVAGRMIPLNQVISGIEMGWEDPVVMRRNRIPTITVHADPRAGLPSELFNRVRAPIEQSHPGRLPFEWAASTGIGQRPRRPGTSIPGVLAMVFIVVSLFNSVRDDDHLMTVPFAIIGGTAAAATDCRSASCSAYSLGGEQIRTRWCWSRALSRAQSRQDAVDAILDASVARPGQCCWSQARPSSA
jgi:multidrug efflux pump subunit AcrB